jgi:hypothetical protein
VVAFSTGWALQVILDSITIGDDVKPFAVSEKRVGPLCMAYSLESGFDEVCDWMLTDFTLRFALNDLVKGIAGENYPLIASGRAVEAIRHLIAGPNVDPKKGWPLMREALRIDAHYLREITDASTNPRHGARDATGPQQSEMLLRAWTVMNRYLEYRKRGGKDSLPPIEFPMLTT